MLMKAPKSKRKISSKPLVANPVTVDALLRDNFSSFFEKCFYEITGGETYQHNWHLDVMSFFLNNIFETKRLILNVPPRNSKTILDIALTAFILGHYPNKKIICVSYNQDLADEFGLACLKIMRSAWYKRLFPNTKILKEASSKSNFKTTKGGGRIGTSIEGTLTGIGGDLIIIDDPLKAEEGFSEQRLEAVNKWFSNTLYSRLNSKKDSAILVVMQRLHENDLTGYLLESGEKWLHIKMPAIATKNEVWKCGDKTYYRKKGEALHQDREPLEVLALIKKQIGSYNFASQYMQEPAPLEGGFLKKKWIQYYKKSELPLTPSCIIQSWDTASKTGEDNDYSVCTTWLVSESKQNLREYYLLDVFRDKLEFGDSRKKIIFYSKKYMGRYNCPVFVLIEDAMSGTALIQSLKRSKILVHPIQPSGDKVSRLLAITPIFEQGQVFLPEEDLHWKEDYMNELLRFPKAKHDDQVDSTTQALLWRYSIDILLNLQMPKTTVKIYTINRKMERIRSFRDDGRYDHLDPKTAFIMRKLDRP